MLCICTKLVEKLSFYHPSQEQVVILSSSVCAVVSDHIELCLRVVAPLLSETAMYAALFKGACELSWCPFTMRETSLRELLLKSRRQSAAEFKERYPAQS